MARPSLGRFAGFSLTAVLALGLLPAGVMAGEPPVPIKITMNTTADPVGGRPFSFEPVYPAGFVIPEDAVCGYELRWGDDASLLNNEWTDSFGGTIVRGTKAAGYCDGWNLTLPYSSAGQWQWDYTIADNDYNPLITNFAESEDSGIPMFTGSNAPGATGITSSNIPGVWLTMPKGKIGSPITATAHPYGGYTIPAEGTTWMAYGPGDDSEHYGIQGDHHMSFSFVPLYTLGNWSVWFNDSGFPNFAGAGVDPAVTAATPPASHPGTSVKRVRSVKIAMARVALRRHYLPFKVSARGFKGRVSCVISINSRKVVTGCNGRLLFSRTGNRTVTATVTDRYGHRTVKHLRIVVRR